MEERSHLAIIKSTYMKKGHAVGKVFLKILFFEKYCKDL